MSVRSIRLGYADLVAGGPTTLYTVPAGRRTIAKSVSCLNYHAGINRLTLQVVLAGAVLVEWEHMMGSAGTLDEVRHDWVWIVLNAGESLRGSVPFDGVKVVVSGAELIT